MVLFQGYIVVFAVKKRIINGNPWQERKETIFRDTSGISPTHLVWVGPRQGLAIINDDLGADITV